MKLTILSHNLSSNGRFGRRVRPPLAANASLRRHRSGLTRRPDERRPAEQLTLMLLERPLTIGGELKAASEYKGNFSLTKNPKDDVLSLKQKLQLELLYPLTENTSLFLEGEATYEAEPFSEATSLKPKRAIERGQTWLFVGNLLQSNFSLQIGRQSLSDRRSWWWDEDLDAVRLHYDRRRLHAELTLAREKHTHRSARTRGGTRARRLVVCA